MKARKAMVLPENLEHGLEVLGMLCRVLGEDEDVVKEDHNEFVEVRAKGVVHGTLKGCRCVGETKGHDFD
jgi:hypothetical protein